MVEPLQAPGNANTGKVDALPQGKQKLNLLDDAFFASFSNSVLGKAFSKKLKRLEYIEGSLNSILFGSSFSSFPERLDAVSDKSSKLQESIDSKTTLSFKGITKILQDLKLIQVSYSSSIKVQEDSNINTESLNAIYLPLLDSGIDALFSDSTVRSLESTGSLSASQIEALKESFASAESIPERFTLLYQFIESLRQTAASMYAFTSTSAYLKKREKVLGALSDIDAEFNSLLSELGEYSTKLRSNALEIQSALSANLEQKESIKEATRQIYIEIQKLKNKKKQIEANASEGLIKLKQDRQNLLNELNKAVPSYSSITRVFKTAFVDIYAILIKKADPAKTSSIKNTAQYKELQEAEQKIDEKETELKSRLELIDAQIKKLEDRSESLLALCNGELNISSRLSGALENLKRHIEEPCSVFSIISAAKSDSLTIRELALIREYAYEIPNQLNALSDKAKNKPKRRALIEARSSIGIKKLPLISALNALSNLRSEPENAERSATIAKLEKQVNEEASKMKKRDAKVIFNILKKRDAAQDALIELNKKIAIQQGLLSGIIKSLSRSMQSTSATDMPSSPSN
ncbi:MAG: hypothetical protein ABIH99_02790 [Candidatus Micrarchaeota archaeon]